MKNSFAIPLLVGIAIAGSACNKMKAADNTTSTKIKTPGPKKKQDIPDPTPSPRTEAQLTDIFKSLDTNFDPKDLTLADEVERVAAHTAYADPNTTVDYQGGLVVAVELKLAGIKDTMTFNSAILSDENLSGKTTFQLANYEPNDLDLSAVGKCLDAKCEAVALVFKWTVDGEASAAGFISDKDGQVIDGFGPYVQYHNTKFTQPKYDSNGY